MYLLTSRDYCKKKLVISTDLTNPESTPGLFVLAFDNSNDDNKKGERNSHTKCFLPRVNITNYSVLIDGRNVHDQPINDQIRQYDEIRNTATGQRDNYTTGCLLDYQYFKYHYNLIAADISKQKEFDADSRAIQQILSLVMEKKWDFQCSLIL